jgi:hypothetical protein
VLLLSIMSMLSTNAIHSMKNRDPMSSLMTRELFKWDIRRDSALLRSSSTQDLSGQRSTVLPILPSKQLKSAITISKLIFTIISFSLEVPLYFQVSMSVSTRKSVKRPERDPKRLEIRPGYQ